MSSNIFYGAGKNAMENYDRWSDLKPVCFADRDPKKHYTRIFAEGGKNSLSNEDGIEILPLEEAISRYPDYTIYMTQRMSVLRDVRKYLIGAGIPEERIQCLEPVEWRPGCEELNHFIRVSGFRMFTCCYLDAQRGELTTSFEKDFRTTLEKHTKVVNETIQKIKSGVPCVCSNCPSLYYDFWEKEPRYTTLALDGWFKDDICNIDCCYCSQIQKAKSNQNMTLLDAARDLAVLIPDIERWFYTGGEPSIYPQKKELFDFAAGHKWKLIEAFTNAVVYEKFFSNKEVAYGLINCSLDAGNRETYKKIKGKDYFERVVQNLEKYAADGCSIQLKYILLEGLNDDAENIGQFLDIAERIGAAVSLSFNQDAQTHVTKDSPMWPPVELFTRSAKEKNLNLKVEFWPLGQEERETIQKILDESIY